MTNPSLSTPAWGAPAECTLPPWIAPCGWPNRRPFRHRGAFRHPRVQRARHSSVIALGLYGFVATLQPDANFGRILAAYGGVFVAGSLAWGMVVDKFRPDRSDIIGALICLAGVGVIMYFPRVG